MMRILIFIYLIIVSQVTFGDALYSKDVPLPRVYLNEAKKCYYSDLSIRNMDDLLKSNEFNEIYYKKFASRKFLSGTESLYSALCFLSAGAADNSLPYFNQSKRHFIDGIENSIKSLEVAEGELKKKAENTKLFYDLASLAFDFVGIANKNKGASFTEGLSIARNLVNEVKSIQLASISQATKDMKKNDRNIKLNQTIRIPVSPYVGFLKNIVKIQMPSGSHCTGSFVGPKLVLTNLHCVEEGMHVVQDTLVDSRKFTVKTWHTARGERGTLTAEEEKSPVCLEYCEKDDWAIIEINETRQDSNDFFLVKEKTENLESLMVTGYSADVSGGGILTSDINCPVIKIDRNIRYDCSTFGGSSGSAVLSIYDQRFVVALNNAGTVQVDSANNRGEQSAVRVENFYPTWKKLIDQQGGFKQVDARDARHYLKALGDRVNKQDKLEKLDKW